MEEVFEKVDEMEEDMKDSLMKMIRISAIGPENDGEGEKERAEFILELIDDFGFDSVERYDAEDDRVPSGIRPNIVATKEGETDKNLVIVSHMDIVPEGDLEEWDTDPFDPVFEDGKIYGRGAEDNGQALISSIYAVKALTELGVKPEYNMKIVMVSDEETGSQYGVGHLLEEGVIKKDDMVVVPDHSEDEGKKIEIVEKAGLWVKIIVQGKQGHAAFPDQNINANRVIARYQNLVDEELHHEFQQEDELFSPPQSTFEPTKRLANVPNVNSIPGKEVQYFDCRVLPSIDLERVKATFQNATKQIEEETDAEIDIEFSKESEAPERTPEDSDVVQNLKKAIEEVTGVEAGLAGIGGGTVAKGFRRRDIPTAVWCSNKGLAHQPNEYAVLDYMVKDCKVFARFALGE
ncbi:MAG: M20 family metallo-hydrolase [Candidatus Thermoplasmatota archaeon]|nr:M20 family metallo-hydrolase [Candidatus Thermoplasmatota archaeon]